MILDFVGVGVGPSNLSLAALVEPVTDVRGLFLDAEESFTWHSGAMLPRSRLQVSYLKDLVTLVDPTSRFSFLNFLVHHRRAYRALVANGSSASRHEFEQYYQWVASQLPDIRWSSPVDDLTSTATALRVQLRRGGTVECRAAVVGTGKCPQIPECARAHLGPDVLHSSQFMTRAPEVAGRRVLVVGGGQSGAELVDHLLSLEHLPASVAWVTSRVGILPLDDSPFTNEWFSPSYVEHFYGLDAERRDELLRHQRMASDGVSESLLSSIYRRLYQLDVSEPGRLRHDIRANRRLVDVRRRGGRFHVTFLDHDLGSDVHDVADVVVLATGFDRALPDYLASLAPRLLDARGELVVRPDYSLEWDGPPGLRIFVQNAAEHTHGIADPNLSLSAWRSARIINAIADRTVYEIEGDQSTSRWVEQPSRPCDRQALESSVLKKVSS